MYHKLIENLEREDAGRQAEIRLVQTRWASQTKANCTENSTYAASLRLIYASTW